MDEVQREEHASAWRDRAGSSILGRMRRTEARRDPASEVGNAAGAPGRTLDPIRTFLIADVRGYTVFTQEHGDEAAARLATKFAEVVGEQIGARGGSVVELRGDEALAVFGSPREAIRAAADLQRRFLQETMEVPEQPLPVGIGIDVGEAVEVDGGYRGGALNLAARLCGEARPGEILVTHNVVHLARTVDGLHYLDRGQLHLKGLTDPVHVMAIVSNEVDVAERMRSLLPKERGRRAYGTRMQFRILGPLEVDTGRGPLQLGGRKQRAVLAHLILHANELVPAETLVDEVWGDSPPDRSRNIIQTYVSHLRKVLGRDRIETRAPGYRLRLDAPELDASRFDESVRSAGRHAHADPAIAVATFDEALALWRGPALADLADHPSLVAEAARLDELRLQTQEDRLEALLASGADPHAIRDVEVLLAHHPLRERLWGFLMLAMYREGRQAEALAAYQRAREVLADELGIDPSPELTRLHERVLRQDPGLELRGIPLRGYRLLEKIAEGPTGVVFRAIQPHVERDVAVKIVHDRIATDPEFVRRFEQDAQAAAALEHPHVVPVYDYWREPGHAYVVTRYLRGGSLRVVQDRGEVLEAERAFHLVEQVALALAFAHRQGVAHGNIGSANVLFDGEGNAYLADFLVGASSRDTDDDIRALARLTREVLGSRLPPSLAAVVEQAEGGTVPAAEAFAEGARAAFEPAAEVAPHVAEQRNPYKGLRAFTEADAHDFFGRGELTQRLVSRLRESGPGSRFLAVVGPSGCGKSSVVRAGLVPAIRHGALGTGDEPFVAEMFPGANPIEELEAALLRIAVRPVSLLRARLESGSRGLLEALDVIGPGDAEIALIVDQFEELFTLTADDQERELFLESLRVATADPESRLRVIVTLRADFYDRPLTFPRFGELLASRTEAVPPLTPDELEQAIRSPATQVGVRPEPGLVAEMIADVAHHAGALPLLQYALTELFDRRDEDRLTLAAYREIGGIAGALSARAERIHEAADPGARRALRQVLLRLVALGEGRQDTRRRVLRSELDALDVDPDVIEGVIRTFGRHRFLTFDRDPSTREPTVEIAHEALLTAWRRLRTWIDDARDDIREHERLARAGAEWRASGQDSSFLLRGVRLQQVEQWAEITDLAIGKPEEAYLKASVDRREHDDEAERARHEREVRTERRSRRLLQSLVALFAIAAVVTGTLTVIANGQSRRADQQRRFAQSRELAAAAVANLDIDPERSILLAMEAVRATRSADGSVLPEAEEALHRAVASSRIVLSVSGVGGALDWSPKGVFVTEGPEDTGVIDIRDTTTGESVLSFPGHDPDVNDVGFSPDGSMLATTGDDGSLKVWDPATGDNLWTFAGTGAVWGPSFSADGSLVAAAWDEEGRTRLLDASDGHVLKTFTRAAGDTAFSPDGTMLAVAPRWNDWGDVLVFDLRTGEIAFSLEGGFAGRVAWSREGRIATNNGDGSAQVWDGRTGKLLFSLFGHRAAVFGVDWSPDGSRLVTASDDGTAKIWEVKDRGGQEVLSLSAQETAYGFYAAVFSPNGEHVMTSDGGVTATEIWDVGVGGDAEWMNLPAHRGDDANWAGDVRFLPDGRRLASTTREGGIAIWDLRTGRNLRTLPVHGALVSSFDVTDDGSAIAAGLDSGVAIAWDVTTGETLFTVEHDDAVVDVDWSPDGEHLVMTSPGSVTVLDATGRLVRRLNEGGDVFISSARFSPDGRFVVTSVDSTTVSSLDLFRQTIWGWERGREVTSIQPGDGSNAGRVTVFDPTNSRVATSGALGIPRIWEVETGEAVVALPAHSGSPWDIAFSRDGTRVATAGADGVVRLFDAASGELLLELRGHHQIVARVAFSPDGTMLASKSLDGTVRVWALDLDDLLEIARREVTRSLTDEECRQYLHLDACANRR
jgi:WD40 repeat protein/DNA-binding SARP family transcriptional activator/class 3 adenylate cyclase/tRNA A-37 threonylcarbamoyl transferase component Bud32